LASSAATQKFNENDGEDDERFYQQVDDALVEAGTDFIHALSQQWPKANQCLTHLDLSCNRLVGCYSTEDRPDFRCIAQFFKALQKNR
jgi:hypothetical protein